MIDFAHPKSRRFLRNRVISLLVLVIMIGGLYVLISPFQPVLSDEITYQGQKINLLPANLPPEDMIVNDLHLPENAIVSREPAPTAAKPIATAKPTTNEEVKVLGVSYNQKAVAQLAPKQTVNKIVIPKMGVDSTILEGKSDDMLWKGIWRMPVGSTPDQGGNTIITAHRYLYRPPNPKTFYLLDKLGTGDKITVFWQGEKYEYQVTETKIVEPEDVSILHNTAKAQLTLFSCTPLFTSKQRLVVIAEQI